MLLGLFPEALNIVCLFSLLGFYNFHQFHYRTGQHSSSQSYAESQSQGYVLDQAMKGGLEGVWKQQSSLVLRGIMSEVLGVPLNEGEELGNLRGNKCYYNEVSSPFYFNVFHVHN